MSMSSRCSGGLVLRGSEAHFGCWHSALSAAGRNWESGGFPGPLRKSSRVRLVWPPRAISGMGISTEVLNYPDVRRDETVSDDFHGTRIADPYRW